MKQLLSSSAFLVLNKKLSKHLGLNCAVLLADLISKEEYFIQNGMSDGWFFNTEKNIEEDTTLNPYQQRKCLKTLKNEGIIEVKRMGIPAKQYFKINEEQVIEILNNLSVKNSTTINKNKTIINNNKTITDRKLKFEEKVMQITDISKDELQDFIDYWTEHNPKGTKMKFEMQKTFDINLRLKRWIFNSKAWNRNKSSKIDTQLSEYLKGKEYL